MPISKNGHTAEYSRERKIRLKAVSGLDCFCERPTYRKVLRWARYGFRGTRLESHREGNAIMTSREAVERFLEEIQ